MADNPILNGPPNTRSLAKPELHSPPSTQCSVIDLVTARDKAVARKKLEECEMSLQPPTMADLQAALSPLLALCAPLGMTANDRIEWIGAAADTLRDVPADLLHRACRKARSVCDHPAKIIPFVMSDIAESRQLREHTYRSLRMSLERVQTPQKYVDPKERAEVAKMMSDWKEHKYSAAYARKRGWA